MKYSPHLVTISEATTWSKGREVPTEMADHSIDVVIKPTHAALVEVTTLDHLQSMTVHKCDHPHPAKDVPIESLVEVVAEETRKPSTSIKDGRLVLSKTRNKYGRSILHHAVRKGDKKAIKKIIKTMPRLLYQVDSRGNHPLHYAANASVSDSFAIVYMLVKAGASLNALNNRLQSPLLMAACHPICVRVQMICARSLPYRFYEFLTTPTLAGLMTLPFRVKPLDWQKKTVPSVLSG